MDPPTAACHTDDDGAIERNAKTEYANWTVNTPLLYDFVATHMTEWPTMSVDSLPTSVSSGGDKVSQGLIVGTYTGGAEQNYLMVMDVSLPAEDVPAASRIYGNHGDYGGFAFGDGKQKFKIRRKIPLPVEANRAIHMPQLPHLVAVVGPEANALILDTSIERSSESSVVVDVRLVGHTAEGWGLAWNSIVEGRLVTADDKGVYVWDVSNERSGDVKPIHTFMVHRAAPQDLSWKPMHPEVFASVGDDGLMQIMDIRQATPVHTVSCSSEAVNCVCYNPHIDYLVATAGSSKDITLFDDRQLPHSVHRMHGHDGAVVRALFHPDYSHFLASASQDRRVNIWDLRKIGMEQRPEDAEDGPPELAFSHGGHVSSINDICWTSNICGSGSMVVSASDDNMMQVWKMNSDLFGNGEADDGAETVDTDFEVELQE